MDRCHLQNLLRCGIMHTAKEARMNKYLSGNAAELMTMVEFSKRDFVVSVPFGGKAPYDLVVEKEGILYRIQVKTIYLGKAKNGTRWMVDFMKPRNVYNKANGDTVLRYAKYSRGDCDFLVAVCPEHNAFYIFPVDAISTRRQASFYFEKPPPSRARGTEWVKGYHDAWPQSRVRTGTAS